MRYLFVHQNFPGQYLHVVRHLLTDPDNEVVFISEPNKNRIPGVRRVNYQPARGGNGHVHVHARDFDAAARRAETVAAVASNIKHLGFTPDIIVGHHGWGELLNLPDVWPGTPLLGYFEFYYSPQGQDVGYDTEFPVGPEQHARIRAMNVVNHLALALNQHGQTPTHWQHTRYPEWARPQIALLPEGAQLDVCRPDPAARSRNFTLGKFIVRPDEKLITYVARNLEPYRGFHVMMRALPALLRARPDARVVLVGGDSAGYGSPAPTGTWRSFMLDELAGSYDATRVLLPGQLDYATYLRLLQRSDAHVYLTYPFVASWSLREAMACGCAIVAADVDPVGEFIADGKTGLLTPGLDPVLLAERILQLLDSPRLARRLGRAARRHAEQHLDMADHIAAFERRVDAVLVQTSKAGVLF